MSTFGRQKKVDEDADSGYFVRILIGVLLGFVTQDVIRRLLGEESGFLGILTSAVVGGVMFIPSLIAFPLAASLLVRLFPDNREQVFDTSWRFLLEMFSIPPAIVILIGLFAVFVPKQMVELQFMGLEFTLVRLTLTLVAAVLMGLALGVKLEEDAGGTRTSR